MDFECISMIFTLVRMFKHGSTMQVSSREQRSKPLLFAVGIVLPSYMGIIISRYKDPH